MRKMVDTLIRQYGTELQLRCGGEVKTARGFFRAVSSRDMQSMELESTPLGTVSRKKYTYLGPADLPVSMGDTVMLDGKCYSFRRAEPYYYGDQLLYYWGLCMEKDGEDVWGSQS